MGLEVDLGVAKKVGQGGRWGGVCSNTPPRSLHTVCDQGPCLCCGDCEALDGSETGQLLKTEGRIWGIGGRWEKAQDSRAAEQFGRP